MFTRSLLTLFGWRFEGELPNLPKLVVIAAPHTSNWDFPLGMAIIFALGVRLSWMGKHTFIRGPMGRVLRWMGGIAIDRTAPHGVVEQIVAEFDRREKFILGLAPEGTRRRVPEWKTGFYFIAQGADVPIIPIAFDYRCKVIGIGQPIYPSGNLTADMEQIKLFYRGVVGKNPHQATI